MAHTKLFQVLNTEGDPVGLYQVPVSMWDTFAEVFHELEKSAYNEDVDDLQEYIDTHLEDMGVERVFVSEEITANHL